MISVDNRELDTERRRAVRKKAIKLIKLGATVLDISKKTKYSTSNIYRLKKQLGEFNQNEAREEMVVTGRPRNISPANEELIYQAIVTKINSVDSSPLWDWARVQEFVKNNFEVSSSQQLCLRIINRLGFVFRDQKKRLAGSSLESKKDYESILKMAKASGGDVYFIDVTQTSIEVYRKYGKVRPEYLTENTKNIVTVLGAINPKNAVKFWGTTNRLSSSRLCDFLSYLVSEASHPVHLILDKYPECCHKQFTHFVTSRPESLKLHYLNQI